MEDLEEMRQLSQRLAQAERQPWEPRCVCRTFARPVKREFVFTMQTWIDLEFAKSPLLKGQLPEAEEVLDALPAALAAFDMPPATGSMPPQLAIETMDAMIDEILEAFGMLLKLQPLPGTTLEENGIGSWLPLFSFLICEAGLPRAEALTMPVGQVFALAAGRRCNEGRKPAGPTYAQRDLIQEIAAENHEEVTASANV